MSALSAKQQENLKYFKENLTTFLENDILKNKFVIIYGTKIVGSFDTFENALIDAIPKYPRDEFIIQQVVSESEIISFLYSARKSA